MLFQEFLLPNVISRAHCSLSTQNKSKQHGLHFSLMCAVKCKRPYYFCFLPFLWIFFVFCLVNRLRERGRGVLWVFKSATSINLLLRSNARNSFSRTMIVLVNPYITSQMTDSGNLIWYFPLYIKHGMKIQVSSFLCLSIRAKSLMKGIWCRALWITVHFYLWSFEEGS